MQTGVYLITSPSGKFYIGSTTYSFRKRWDRHRSELRRNKHNNKALQSAWNKYGEERLVFTVYLRCAPDQCRRLEQVAIDELRPAYNMALIVAALGATWRHTPETIAKMKESRKSVILPPQTEAHKRKVSEALLEFNRNNPSPNIGRPATPECRAKRSMMAKARTGEYSLGGRPVRCLELGRVFHSARDAMRCLREEGLTKSTSKSGHIGEVCKGYPETACGFHWAYVEPDKTKNRKPKKLFKLAVDNPPTDP